MKDRKLKILAIDDNQDNLTTLKAVIADAIPGTKVITALDGSSGIMLALSENPDVILLDIVMPVVDGLSVCRNLKQDDRISHIPIIMLTALKTDRKTRIKALEVGAEAFLTKPLDEVELIAQVKAMAKIKESADLQRMEKSQLAALVSERTLEIEKELNERRKAENELQKANEKLKQTQVATLNLLEDLRKEMTIREKTEAELIIAKNKAEESDRLKSAFLANMSHEIRTPMNGIIGFSELLKETDLETNERDRYIRIINDNCQQLLHIISDIIDISKVEAGLVEPEHIEFCLNELMDSLVENYLPKASLKGLKMIIHKEIEHGACWILSDQSKIHQVLDNLITNAIKFTQAGTIDFGYKFRDQRLEFFVKDTGIGISDEHRKAIFDRFWQVENGLARKYGGTGLGLAISSAFVKKLGGEIMVESTPGKGSCFSFSVPYILSEMKKSSTMAAMRNVFDVTGKTILIVEDEPDNYDLLNIILGRLKINILHAWDGKEAMQIFSEHAEIDMVLMDFKLPDMPGQEVTRKMLNLRSDVPVIATTAYAMSGDREKAIQAGCTGYLAKPIRSEELIAILKNYLN
ncbi:MAG: response regulator [Bacteroidetes bacterium]|nr:response regulator [Bacteroidota bacterium]